MPGSRAQTRPLIHSAISTIGRGPSTNANTENRDATVASGAGTATVTAGAAGAVPAPIAAVRWVNEFWTSPHLHGRSPISSPHGSERLTNTLVPHAGR